MNLDNWLQDTRAESIMTRDIITFEPQDVLAQVAETLMTRQISGGPVVSDSVCVGVITVNDLIAAEGQVAADREKFAQSSFWDGGLTLPVSVYEERLAAIRAKIAPTAEQPVHRFMSTDLVDVRPVAPVQVVIEKMIQRRIHRVLVTDSERHLLGLITTIDVLKALHE